MLKIEHVDLYYGDIQILYDISFEIKKGIIVSLVGGNGAGKTTLINTITGLIRPRKGIIFFENDRIDLARTDEIVKKGLVQVPEGRKLFGKLTVLENLEMGVLMNEQNQKERRI